MYLCVPPPPLLPPVIAMTRRDEGDYEGAHSMARASCYISVIGIVLGFVAIIVVTALYFAAQNDY